MTFRLAVAIGLAAQAGCGSFTHFQTGRSMHAGQIAYDIQGANVAENDGTHIGVRFRVGLGRGFEVGTETDIVSAVLAEGGGSTEFGLLMGDLKWQFLEERRVDVEVEEGEEVVEPDEGGAPVSMAVGFGGGSGFLTDFYFGQLTASRRFGFAEPYVAWRYQRFRLDANRHDEGDLEELEDSFIGKVFEEAEDTRFGLHHLFFGVKLWLSDGIYLIPEVSWIYGDADGVGSIGLAFGGQSP